MGSKVNPVAVRIGKGKINSSLSKWYARSKDYPKMLAADRQVRELINTELKKAYVSKIMIKRPKNAVIDIELARAAVAIGPKGERIEKLRQKVSNIMGVPVQIALQEIKKPELDAKLVARGICEQLEKRVPFRRAMKRAAQNAMRLGAKGIKIQCAGRLGGAEIARREWIREGRVPLHTFRADIDYALYEAQTTYGIIGVKVWIFKGEVFGRKKDNKKEDKN